MLVTWTQKENSVTINAISGARLLQLGRTGLDCATYNKKKNYCDYGIVILRSTEVREVEEVVHSNQSHSITR